MPIELPGCDVTMHSDSGVIQSPGYDVVAYPNMVKCTWSIKASKSIRLKFKNQVALKSGDKVEVNCWLGIYILKLLDDVCIILCN